MRRLVFTVAVAGLSARAAADEPSRADPTEDKDVDLIPKDLPQDTVERAAAPAPPWTLRTKLFAEEAFTLGAGRGVAVPFPPPLPYDWQNRTSLDLALTWRPNARLAVELSDRLDVIAEDGDRLGSDRLVRNELREAYITWEPVARTYLEAGRINVRNGAALGFNPTDFFKTRTLVGQASLDPSVLSQNRLGTVMVRAQTIWGDGAASLAFAPKLADPAAIASRPVGIDPRFDATNAQNRVLGTVSQNVGDLAAQALLYWEPDRWAVGVNLTQPIGQSIIAYAEWAGVVEADLVARAVAFGRDTGTLPAGATPPIPADDGRALRNDLAVGASWTLATTLTLNLEYHFHQAGLSGDDWDRWFDAGRDHPELAPELWYIRGYAADQREPASRHQAFIRVAWPKALIDHLEIDAFAFVNLVDGSTLSQITASDYLSDAWTLTASLGGYFGSARSEQGSFPQAVTGIAEVIRHF